MSSSRPPKFSRVSLNLLMLVSIVLIVILYEPLAKQTESPLPQAPQLDASIWLSDSGSQVWFHPALADGIEIQLWFRAGFRYDGQHKGRAHLLAQLLKYESVQRKLPMAVSLDQDFIKIALHLSGSPVVLKRQIEQSQALLYHPQLSRTRLNKLRHSRTSLSEDLRQQAYGQHAYAGPQRGTAHSLREISRADLQSFHHHYLHPQRLSASIVGDVSERSAAIIMESLLPTSAHIAASDAPLMPLVARHASHDNMAVLVKPGLSNLRQPQQQERLVKDYLLMQVLQDRQPSHSRWVTGQSNNTLFLQQLAQFRQNMREHADWDMILSAKRRLASHWLQQVAGAKALSRYLVHLNAYDLPVNHMQLNLQHLQSITLDSWQQFYQTQLSEISL
ncbi:MAG: hypothetical protein RPR40_13825 [Bermanella sp.]